MGIARRRFRVDHLTTTLRLPGMVQKESEETDDGTIHGIERQCALYCCVEGSFILAEEVHPAERVKAAVVLYAGWCEGTSGAMKGLQFGLLMGVLVACVHPISNLVTMNMDLKLGLEVSVSTFVGWVLVGIVIGLVYEPTIAAVR